jgi:hypothetical protein
MVRKSGMLLVASTVSKHLLLDLLLVLVICLRHNCPAKKAHERSGQVQSVLKYNTDGTLQRWEYSASIARTELCRLIARDDLPLWHGSHNPRFVHVSRQTTVTSQNSNPGLKPQSTLSPLSIFYPKTPLDFSHHVHTLCLITSTSPRILFFNT